jgi:hypothetical protein
VSVRTIAGSSLGTRLAGHAAVEAIGTHRALHTDVLRHNLACSDSTCTSCSCGRVNDRCQAAFLPQSCALAMCVGRNAMRTAAGCVSEWFNLAGQPRSSGALACMRLMQRGTPMQPIQLHCWHSTEHRAAEPSYCAHACMHRSPMMHGCMTTPRLAAATSALLAPEAPAPPAARAFAAGSKDSVYAVACGPACRFS